MKIFKSIKWRLQIWNGLILVLVLAGFGLTAYQLERDRQFRQIDEALQSRFGFVADALRGRGPGDFRPPPGQFPPEGAPDQNFQPQRFHLPPEYATLFDSGDPHNFYFIIQLPDGDELRSTNAPASIVYSEYNGALREGKALPQFHPHPQPAIIMNGKILESDHFMPSGETIRVGCSIAPELHQLKIIALNLIGIGCVILIFGLAGGWWIVSRAIRPVENISATALKISAGDLSRRINVAETESELGQLASVLNATFARLETAFTQQRQFASDAAHELRTPVSVILTQTQTALAREREARDYKQTVEACQRAAQRMRKLIGALLELARLDAGQEQMKRQHFDFSKAVADCVELIRPLADERGVKMLVELSPLEITGDSERLGQVVTNLLTNAIEYNHDGGEVKITVKVENGMAMLTVSDTGQGIPAEDLQRVFERFYRADKSRSSGNAGLGLAICKAIVVAHGGSIELASEEHAGTTFTVRLPM